MLNHIMFLFIVCVNKTWPNFFLVIFIIKYNLRLNKVKINKNLPIKLN